MPVTSVLIRKIPATAANAIAAASARERASAASNSDGANKSAVITAVNAPKTSAKRHSRKRQIVSRRRP